MCVRGRCVRLCPVTRTFRPPQAPALQPRLVVTRTPFSIALGGPTEVFRQAPHLPRLWPRIQVQQLRTDPVQRAWIRPTNSMPGVSASARGFAHTQSHGRECTLSSPDVGADPFAIAPLGALAAEHSHHWMIAKQDGPSSEGTCKQCGARRDFLNSFVRAYTYRAKPPAELAED